jgi:hypothetical protein
MPFLHQALRFCVVIRSYWKAGGVLHTNSQMCLDVMDYVMRLSHAFNFTATQSRITLGFLFVFEKEILRILGKYRVVTEGGPQSNLSISLPFPIHYSTSLSLFTIQKPAIEKFS